MDSDLPFHLLLPLAASVLFAMGLIFVKKAGQRGASSWSVTFVANQTAALVFGCLWFLGGTNQPWTMLWQPGIVALLYIGGQVCTFVALDRGDVSVAAPIFSVKVLMVAFFLTVIARENLSIWIWLAAIAATVGVALIQRSGAHEPHHRVAFTVFFAVLAATHFGLFDVLVQRWAPAWGAGRFLPWVFMLAAILSLGFLPKVDRRVFSNAEIRRPLFAGGFLVAMQSLCIVLAVALFEDAARVNIVYSLRGMWGVLMAWAFAKWLGGGEMMASRRTMASRAFGAALISTAVIIAITRV